MKAVFDGTVVRLTKDGRSLYEQSGYGRLTKDGILLAPAEALYLLHRQKIAVEGYTFDELFSEFASQAGFLRRFLVYRDLRERGYVVQPGPHDFRVFRRGERPGTGESLYLVRVLSEREPVRFTTLAAEVVSSRNMRKQYVLAVVDDEDELTYYEIKLQQLTSTYSPAGEMGVHHAVVVGRSAMVHVPPKSELEEAGFGTRLDSGRLMFSPAEVLYLMDKGALTLADGKRTVLRKDFLAAAAETDPELSGKALVYAELRRCGYVPRTGYKFGHHFRVYCGKGPHSDLLVHAVLQDSAMPMSVISRSVRMAHSVKKKMFFGAVHSSRIPFVEFARIKL